MEKPFITVSAADPAIDLGAMTRAEMVAFSETRDFGIVKSKFKPGAKPVLYTLAPISHRLMTMYVMNTDNEADRNARAFMCSVRSVENMPNEDGTTLTTWQAPTEHGVMRDDALDRFAPYEIQEIGGVAFARSFFGQRMQPDYRLPPLLASLLGGKTYRPADASPSSAEPSKPVASSSQEAST